MRHAKPLTSSQGLNRHNHRLTLHVCLHDLLTSLICITFWPASPEVTPDEQVVGLDVDDEESSAHSIHYHLIMLGIAAISVVVIL